MRGKLAMSADQPSPGHLWNQAGGNGDRYRDLLHQHGLLLRPGDEGYDQASRTLPCGYPGPSKPATEWCKHELAPGTCSVCTGRGEPAPEEHDKASLGHVFTARYAAPCGWCGERFQPGERVRGRPG
jgi:hypothetical protein